ncbi:MAG: ABC transporter permease [Parvularculaceae bacterium]
MNRARAIGVYAGQRFVSLVLTLFAASVVIFILLQIAPGDPATYMMGLSASSEAVQALRDELGLSAAPVDRYAKWIGGLMRGDFGVSYTYRAPVAGLIAERLSVSAPLAAFALAMSVLLGLPLGFVAAAQRGRPLDALVMTVTQIGLAAPNFWFAILLVYLFSVVLGWASAGGFPGWDAGFVPAMRALLLPAFVLALPQAAILARVMRSALIDAEGRNYMLTARAKGLSESEALWRHAFRNALIPALTIIGLQFSFLVAGGVIIENVFYLPGLGRLVFQAITQRDLIVVQGVVFILVLIVVSVNFVIDIGYAIIDPRLRRAP